jgi:hypothetical protein
MNTKKTLLAFIIVAGLIVAYVLSFTSTRLHCENLEGSQPTHHFVTLGIRYPYNAVTGNIFSIVYAPMIEYATLKTPPKTILCQIRYIDLKNHRVSIIDENKNLGVAIPELMIECIKGFRNGDSVYITYVHRPVWASPYTYNYVLKSIKSENAKT